jgi:hypothetical protein
MFNFTIGDTILLWLRYVGLPYGVALAIGFLLGAWIF